MTKVARARYGRMTHQKSWKPLIPRRPFIAGFPSTPPGRLTALLPALAHRRCPRSPQWVCRRGAGFAARPVLDEQLGGFGALEAYSFGWWALRAKALQCRAGGGRKRSEDLADGFHDAGIPRPRRHELGSEHFQFTALFSQQLHSDRTYCG